MLFKKKTKYEMDTEIANAALQNILAACDKAPNTIPFDKILLRQKFNSRVYTTPIIIVALVLLFTLFTPLCLVPLSKTLAVHFPLQETKLVTDYVENNTLYLQFSGEERILYHDAYLETLDGELTKPLSYDAKNGTICFPYYANTESNIHIPLYNGEFLHLLLTPIP